MESEIAWLRGLALCSFTLLTSGTVAHMRSGGGGGTCSRGHSAECGLVLHALFLF